MNQIYFWNGHKNLFHDNNKMKYTFSCRFLFNPCYRRSETGPALAARTARRWIPSLVPTQRRKLPQLFPEVSASRGSVIATPREVTLTPVRAFFLFSHRYYLNSKLTLRLRISTNLTKLDDRKFYLFSYYGGNFSKIKPSSYSL